MTTTAMIHDTLKLAEQLEHDAGFDALRAKALARILAENTVENLATREDLRAEIQAVKLEIQTAKAGLQSQIQDIRGDIRVLRWMTGTTLAGMTALLGMAISVALHVMHLG